MLLDGSVQSGDLLFLGSKGKVSFIVLLCGDGLQLAAQLGYLGILLGCFHLLFGLMSGVDISHSSAEFSFKFLVLHLSEDECIVGFVYGKHASAFGALQFFHIYYEVFFCFTCTKGREFSRSAKKKAEQLKLSGSACILFLN